MSITKTIEHLQDARSRASDQASLDFIERQLFSLYDFAVENDLLLDDALNQTKAD